MTEQKYDMHLIATAKMAGDIIQILDGTGILVSMTPAAEERGVTKKKQRYVDGKRDKGIRADDLVLQTLARGPSSIDALEAEFVRRGFAVKSASPTVSRLRAANKIATKDGTYVLINGAA